MITDTFFKLLQLNIILDKVGFHFSVVKPTTTTTIIIIIIILIIIIIIILIFTELV